MIYKIIVDTQPYTNPTANKKTYEIDIEELRFLGDVHDSLVITNDEDYVMRRLDLSEYGVLSVKQNPVKETLSDINIELFEGDNYIYILNEVGNRFLAKYIIKNDFTDTYVTINQMNSSIIQTAGQIQLTVSQIYETKENATTNYSQITQTMNGISSVVSTKVGDDEVISKINQSAEAVTIDANKISLAGKTINMTSDNIVINSTNFSVDNSGNMTCTNANISGGSINLNDNGTYGSGHVKFNSSNRNTFVYSDGLRIFEGATQEGDVSMYSLDSFGIFRTNGTISASVYSNGQPWIGISDYTNGTYCSLYGDHLNINGTYYYSKESIKKNIKPFKNALDIINKTEIYEYNYKYEKEDNKKHIGFVIPDEGGPYKTPDDILAENKECVDVYSTIGIMWKAIQEQQKQIEELKQELQEMKEERNG